MCKKIKPIFGIIFIMLLGGCDTSGGSENNYYDEPFKKAVNPYTTAFKYFRGFSGQKVAYGQAGGVRTIRYYVGGKFVGQTQFVIRSWFSTQTEDDVKNRLLRIVKQKFPNDTPSPNALETYRNLEDFGVYFEKNGCVFMSFYKRLKGSGLFDNDYGAPDFIGLFRVCDGLTVSPKEFIRRIDIADEEDKARFSALMASPSAANDSVTENKNSGQKSTWQTRSIAVQWTGFSELIAGEISFRKNGQAGRIKLTLSKTLGQCSGTYRMTGQRSGTWSIACTNGMTASGLLETYGSGKGSSGEGEDNKGHSVKFTVGGRT